MADARVRKQDRYAALVNDISDKGYICEPFTITKECVSSLKTVLKYLKIPLKCMFSLKNSISKASVLASYVIFYSKYDNNWTSPGYIRM